MRFWELFMIAVGLSMDAVAVSASNGMAIKNIRKKHAFFIALSFGAFQGIMPLIGYFAGSAFSRQMSALDHWIALILLGFIGGKMILEAVNHKEGGKPAQKVLTPTLLLVQALATSIDALAVGVSFAALKTNILAACLFIAGTTFTLSFAAVFIGRQFGTLLNKKAEIFGGAILVLIGAKIFTQHMFF